MATWKMAETGEIPITDERMTRFLIPLETAVEMVWHALQDCNGGEIYVKKCPSMKVVDIAKTISPKAKLKFIGIRPGEKLHEQMISVEDARNTLEFEHYFKIYPVLDQSCKADPECNGKTCAEGFAYSSDLNEIWMKPAELESFLKQEYSRKKK